MPWSSRFMKSIFTPAIPHFSYRGNASRYASLRSTPVQCSHSQSRTFFSFANASNSSRFTDGLTCMMLVRLLHPESSKAYGQPMSAENWMNSLYAARPGRVTCDHQSHEAMPGLIQAGPGDLRPPIPRSDAGLDPGRVGEF